MHLEGAVALDPLGGGAQVLVRLEVRLDVRGDEEVRHDGVVAEVAQALEEGARRATQPFESPSCPTSHEHYAKYYFIYCIKAHVLSPSLYSISDLSNCFLFSFSQGNRIYLPCLCSSETWTDIYANHAPNMVIMIPNIILSSKIKTSKGQ